MKSTRCEEVIVQLIVRTYDDAGRPVQEQTSAPTKVFRNSETRDFWAHCDEAVAALLKQQAAPEPPAPQSKRGAKAK